jgi:hypothetical protein
MPPKKRALAKQGGHRGVAHPKTKKETAEYFQQWYKKNRSKVLKRIKKQRLAGGANGDDDEGETDSEMDTDDEDEVNPLALPHFWNGQEWVPVVPNPPPANLMEDDEIIEGNGYYRMKDGCALYTGGSHVEPVNYSGELKDNSWYPMGYSGGARVMPVNHSAELTRSFNNY